MATFNELLLVAGALSLSAFLTCALAAFALSAMKRHRSPSVSTLAFLRRVHVATPYQQ